MKREDLLGAGLVQTEIERQRITRRIWNAQILKNRRDVTFPARARFAFRHIKDNIWATSAQALIKVLVRFDEDDFVTFLKGALDGLYRFGIVPLGLRLTAATRRFLRFVRLTPF